MCVCIYIYIHINIYTHIYISPKIEVSMTMPRSDIMLWKRALHKYVPIYAFIHMRKALFENIIIKLGIGICKAILWNGA